MLYGTIEDLNRDTRNVTSPSSYIGAPGSYYSDGEEDSPYADLTNLLNPSAQTTNTSSPENNWAYKIISCLCWPCENNEEP